MNSLEGRLLLSLAAFVAGAGLAFLVPLPGRAAHGASEAPRAPEPVVRVDVVAVPVEPADPDDPAATIERADLLELWGRPPLPTGPRLTEDDVADFLAELHPDYELRSVDCHTYPCVANLVSWENHPEFRKAVMERFPHAKVLSGAMIHARGDREISAHRTQVALLGAPIEVPGPEWIHTYRLLQAIAHRDARDDLDHLYDVMEREAAAEEGE